MKYLDIIFMTVVLNNSLKAEISGNYYECMYMDLIFTTTIYISLISYNTKLHK